LQRFHVTLAIPQLLDDADAVRVPKNSKECGKLPSDQKSVRHGSSPFCYKIQTFEYKVLIGHPAGKSRAIYPVAGCDDMP
jgi:hypothetical protein